jgi:hypothetical protein
MQLREGDRRASHAAGAERIGKRDTERHTATHRDSTAMPPAI